jgi:riboflavin biosynthesis pyrimidine reductase
LLTSGGDLDFRHPALARGAIVMTTTAGAKKIGDRLPATCELVQLGKGKSLDIRKGIAELRRRGLDVLLSEGGPHVMGELIGEGLLDEVFLTLSPVVAGRGKEKRLGMVEGVELLPANGAWSKLLSARQHEDYLFLRYRVGKSR